MNGFPNTTRRRMRTETAGRSSAMRRTRHPAAGRILALWPLAVALAVTLAVGFPMLLFPLGPDQSIFAYIAHRMSMGGFPYVSAWDFKPPAIFLLYIVALHVPGAPMRDVRLFDLGMLCLTVATIYLLGQALWGSLAGGFGALLFGTAYAT